MGKVVAAHVDDAKVVPFPALAGVSPAGSIRTRGVLSTPDRPLWLWMHELAPGAQIRWDKPALGHVVYVWKGAAGIAGQALAPEWVVSIEHQGNAVIEAGADGATLLHYHSRDTSTAQLDRPGGHVHVRGPDGMVKVKNYNNDMTTIVWADSKCPTCEVWMHKSEFGTPFPQGLAHFHPEHEIIFVTEGGMIVGRQIHKPGTALAVDSDTVYGFGVDAGGLGFTNFRPSEPHFVMKSRNGPEHAPISEYDHLAKSTLISKSA